ncbi:MAG: 23S rRNA (uracil(1939)-C(5))-methyltransferase RlmD [Muribaculaceae bacterium]|nr:23S rRNA (uracil(1939)-C(5))-methyltransferase RlmD [Muribaculum sp.]MCM1295302.1 23S rRNA (uracil(1939)-C(5))-methyltransferase RlmD [Muribaculaceae bacterium]
MARKRKELPLLQGVEIIDVAAEGNSLAKVDEMVVFIPFGAPGDIADVKIDKKKKSYAEGHIENLIRPSDVRVEPRCEHFTVCGGCRWQHLPYEFQLKCKHQQVQDALQRIAKIPLPEINPIIGSENVWEYRNKMEYTFSNKMWLTFDQLKSGQDFPDRRAAGFHIPGAFDKVLDINKCHLQDDLGNRIRLFIKNFGKEHGYSFYDLREQHGFLRTLMIRIASTGEVMVIMVVGENDPDKIEELMAHLSNGFPEITSLGYVINTKVNDTIADQEVVPYKGREYIEEDMEGLRFRIGPKSFYQTNSRQAYKLYSVARKMAALTGEELVYDLYTGTGTIACFIAPKVRHVIGIEYVPEAIEDAKVNASVNGLNNTEFFAGDMKDILTSDFINAHGIPDVMIVDPPRAGMHENVVKVILDAEPRKIVYVSCNPATQARDLALLHEKYDIAEVQPVDMFPHTQHVENVVLLKLR